MKAFNEETIKRMLSNADATRRQIEKVADALSLMGHDKAARELHLVALGSLSSLMADLRSK